MDRQTVYPFQIPYETDYLSGERFAYEGLGLLAMDILGTSTLVSGISCTPTGPATLNVIAGIGRIYAKKNLEDSTWGNVGATGGLGSDTNANHQILKQGLLRDPVTLPVAAPGTPGFSINYLIQAALTESDIDNIVLPFVDPNPPYEPWSGPDNTGSTLPTQRVDVCTVNAKAGTAAATGTQTTPAPDAGFVGLYVVTVANGQTQVLSGDISLYGGAPFITETLTQKIGLASGDARYVKQTDAQAQTYTAFNDTGASNAYVINPSPAITAYAKYQRFSFQAAHLNTGASTLNVNGKGAQTITRRDGTALVPGDIWNGSLCDVEYDGTNFQLLSATPSGSVPTTRQIATTNGLQGGGDLSADRTLSPVYGTAVNTVMQGNDTRVVNAVPNTRNVNTTGGLTGGGALSGDLTISGSLLAPLASPALTGTPTAPTPTSSDNSTKLATTAFVQTAVSGLPLSAVFSSTGNSFTFGSAVGPFTHNLGGRPTLVFVTMVCVGPNATYSVGDEINATMFGSDTGSNSHGITIQFDATTLTVNVGSNAFYVCGTDFAQHVITAADWTMTVHAYR